jgi:enolase
MRDTTIVSVTGRRVWTSAGAPALEAEIELRCGARGRSIVTPASGAWSEKSPAALTVASVNGLLAAGLQGIDARRQEDVDATLFKLDPGGDACARRAARCACSLAAAHAAAQAAGVPLFRHLHPGRPARMPLPAVELVGDVIAASPFRSLVLLPFAADGVDEALAVSLAIRRAVLNELGAAPALVDERTVATVFSAIEQTGFVPAEEVGVAIDVGAARLYRDNRYVCADGAFDTAQWTTRLVRLVERFPVAAIEDPFADAADLELLTPSIDMRARVVGNDLFASDAERIAAAAEDRLASGVVLRPEAAGSLSELAVAANAARAAAWPVLLASDAGGEDTSLAHIATAWQASYIKLGGVGRGSLARWNELLRIEASLQPAPSLHRLEAAARLVH